MRAVLLATGGWPFIIRYFLETFKLWQDSVDHLYIAVDFYSQPQFSDYLHNQIKNNKKIILLENCSHWPDSYTDAYKASTEDLFLILHDDTFIKTPKLIDRYFKLAERGYVVTPPHEIYSPQDKVENMLDTKYPGVFPFKAGDQHSYSFLLYLLFISRENLEKTTINFNGWADGVMAADTGFKLMLDLLDKGVKIYPIPENSTGALAFSNDPFGDLSTWKFNEIEWIHLQNIGNTLPLIIETDTMASTWSHEGVILRLGWLYEFIRIYSQDLKQLSKSSYVNKTLLRLETIINHFNIEKTRIIKYADLFHELIFGKEKV